MRFEHCSVQTLQTFNPQVLKQFLQINESFLRPKFPEPRKSSKLNNGRPRIGPRWVIVALSILGRLQNISWRNMPDQFSSCQFLIDEGYLKKIPCKSTFHATWNSIPIKSLESWTRRLGYAIAKQYDHALACDSTGFKRVGSSLWGYLKWVQTRLSKTSKIFVKAHVCISLPSRAIVAICFSRSIDSDAKIFAKIWKQISKRLLPCMRRFYLDNGYWSGNILGLIDQHQIYPVVKPRTGLKDWGTDSPTDLVVRAYNNYPGLYRHNHKPNHRSSVEHVFGLIKLKPLLLYDKKEINKLKTLLTPFLWYNFILYTREVKC